MNPSPASVAFETTLAVLVFFTMFVLPFVLSARVCRNRNRSIVKGLFVTFFTGWIGTTFLWLGLRRRDPNSGQLL